jgi:hypothetical protein
MAGRIRGILRSPSCWRQTLTDRFLPRVDKVYPLPTTLIDVITTLKINICKMKSCLAVLLAGGIVAASALFTPPNCNADDLYICFIGDLQLRYPSAAHI